MPDFNITTGALRVRPANVQELNPPARMGRAPSTDYLKYQSGPREVGARQARVGAGVAAFRMGMEALNEYSVKAGTRNWLRANEANIIREMQRRNHSVFIVRVNYALHTAFDTRSYSIRGTHLLGTVPDLSQVHTILTHQFLHGPQMDAPPPPTAKWLYANLIGQRA